MIYFFKQLSMRKNNVIILGYYMYFQLLICSNIYNYLCLLLFYFIVQYAQKINVPSFDGKTLEMNSWFSVFLCFVLNFRNFRVGITDFSLSLTVEVFRYRLSATKFVLGSTLKRSFFDLLVYFLNMKENQGETHRKSY